VEFKIGQKRISEMSPEKPQILEHIFNLMDCFSMEQPDMGVREAARLAGLPSSTAGRIMAGLKEIGVFTQNPDTHTYSLGGKVLAWAGVYTSTLDVRKKALPIMEELNRTTRETISLYLMEGYERVCVEMFESPQNVRIVARVGRRLPIYAGSAGKVFLAFLEPEKQKEVLKNLVLEQLTPKTIDDISLLKEEIEKIREQGFAVSHGEWILEASGVAAPIFDQLGEVCSVLTISGPTQRFDDATIQLLVSQVVKAAAWISQEMGCPAEKSSIALESIK
jgi:IclR family KDG regulon transcriptional repressor